MNLLHNTKQKYILEKISKVSIFLGLSILIVGFLTLSFSFFRNAQARQEDIVVDSISQPINIDRVDSFFLYFSYGSKDNKILLQNIQFQIDMVGSGFEFVRTGFADIYNSNTRSDVNCNNIPPDSVNQINPDLFVNSKLTYAPQTANSKSIPNGMSTPEKLEIAQHGCIRVELKVQNGAISGLQSNVIFEPDFANSNSYTEKTKPSRQIFKLATGPANGSPASFESITASRPQKDSNTSNIVDVNNSAQVSPISNTNQNKPTSFFVPDNLSNNIQDNDNTPNVGMLLIIGSVLVGFGWFLWIFKIQVAKNVELV